MVGGNGLISSRAARAEGTIRGDVGAKGLQEALRGLVHGFGRERVQHLAGAFDRLRVSQGGGPAGAVGSVRGGQAAGAFGQDQVGGIGPGICITAVQALVLPSAPEAIN